MNFNSNFGGLSEQEQFEMAIKLSLEEEEKNKKQTLLKEKKAPTQEVNQWVKDVTAFSTEYSSWPAKNVCGPSNTYPNYGDLQTCWAPSQSTGTQEYLELLYEKKVVPTRLKVYETYNPGALVKVSGKNSKGEWEVLWEGDKQSNKGVSVINEITLKKVEWLTNEIRLDMDCVGQTSYYEIDAVELFGLEVKLPTTLQTPISFANYYLNKDFSDFTFVLKNGQEEEKIPSHKFILANASPKLLKICQETSVLQVEFPEEDFYTVLKYIYTGRFVLTSKNTQTVLKIADKFDIIELRKSCFDFMVTSLNKDTVIETLMKAKNKEYDFDSTDLVQKCIEFIQEKAFDVFPEKTLFLFEKDVMIPLIQGDKLAIDEFELYESLIKWGKNKTQESKQDLSEYLKDILCHVRWPLMDAESLYYKVKPLGHISDEQYLEALEYNLDPTLFNTSQPQFKKRATLFKGSTILNAKVGSYLLKMLPKTEKNWVLIYRGTKHGFDASQFHKQVDNKGETVTIITTSNGNIFGGYNPVSWTTNGGYTNDNKTFLFTLVNQENVPPSKLTMMSGKNGAYNAAGYGPTFGGGHDIYICSNCQSQNSNYSNFGYSFTSPPGFTDTTKKQRLLAGSYNFTVKDIEVFNLQ